MFDIGRSGWRTLTSSNREAGPADAPVSLLLHGFPTASHMFRDLIPHLADRYRLIEPDLPGFGQTKAPPPDAFAYTFDHLAEVIGDFVDALGLQRYALYIFDYGAPTGLRSWQEIRVRDASSPLLPATGGRFNNRLRGPKP